MARNVVLVTVDSLRADHCGFLGGTNDLTPTLDSMAEEGLVFENAVAPGPRTPSSMPVIFTGEFFHERNLDVYRSWEEKSQRWRERRERIRRHLSRFETVAERFDDAGYDTGAVTANPWTTSDTGFDRGFDEFYAVQDQSGSSLGRLASAAVERVMDVDPSDWFLTWPDFYDAVTSIRDTLEEPYFLWVFLLDPHQPYITPRAHRQENTGTEMYYANARYNYAHGYTEDLPNHLDTRLRRAYRDTVRSSDAFVDQLQDDLSNDDPVFVVHADHGEAFQEHGTYGHRPQLYCENVHVPWLIHNIDVNERISRLISLRRLPELLTSLQQPSQTLLNSVSADSFVVSRTEENERNAIRNNRWTLIETGEATWEYVESEESGLYDRSHDPGEHEDVSRQYPEVRRGFREILSRHHEHRRECRRLAEAVQLVTGNREEDSWPGKSEDIS